jgi:hypothetical protein
LYGLRTPVQDRAWSWTNPNLCDHLRIFNLTTMNHKVLNIINEVGFWFVNDDDYIQT